MPSLRIGDSLPPGSTARGRPKKAKGGCIEPLQLGNYEFALSRSAPQSRHLETGLRASGRKQPVEFLEAGHVVFEGSSTPSIHQ